MATSRVAHTPRKSNMMERLRRLRSFSTAQPTATAVPEKITVTAERSADIAKNGKASTSSKSQPQHREGALDLEILNSKLQQYAETCSQDDIDELRKEKEDGIAKGVGELSGDVTKKNQDSVVEVQAKQAIEGGVDSAPDQLPDATSRHSSQNGASTCPSIVVHPPHDEHPAVMEPSDFELFLQQAEDDERIRKEQGVSVSSTPKQKPQINPFYSNNLANPSSAPLLEEIQETGDEESLAETEHSTSQETLSSASSGSNDFAATDTQPTRANTASLGRHVSFCEPVKTRTRSDSHGSAYHARGFESPKAVRSVTKRKSLRKMVRDCIRHL